MQEKIHLVRLYTGHGFLAGDQFFIYHVHCNAHFGLCSAFAIAGLQQPQLALLNGKFHVLHVAMVLFQPVGNFLQLGEHLRHIGVELRDRKCRAGAGHDIFALSIDQVIPFELWFSGRGIAGHKHTGC